MNRLLLPVITLFVALLGSYGILAVGDFLPGRAKIPQAPRGIPARWHLENVHYRVYEGDRRTVDARASSLEIGSARAGFFTLPVLRQARLRDIDATLVDDAGRPTRVRAERAKVDAFRRAWILEGNARIDGPQARAACAKLQWDPITGFVPSPRCLGAVSRP
ncbi:MAG: hypothetical protein Q8R92_00360 [Deltaproteobacteria bacterium]|nr:hypothetical protein [Deltaproteobacteria bacterium]